MAAKSSSRKKNSVAGSWKKKLGARPGLVQFPGIPGALTWGAPPKAFPMASTVSDLGFFGRPKSRHKSHLFNPLHTGGMAFPDVELVPVMRNGRIQWVPPEHDEHRPLASKERKKERQVRKNAKERIARRIQNRAKRLMASDGITYDEALTRAAVQIRSLVARLPQY